jgi:tRNA (adenine-N(1)-)-methyltransferase non-catalytic subunit
MAVLWRIVESAFTVRSQDIVSRLVESSATFQTKTEFAQDKYLKRKEKKCGAVLAA